MDFTFINDYMVPVVLVACLVVGYILKQWITDLENKYIPTILAVLGAVLCCAANNSVDLNNIVYGAVTGLSSVGLHQTFKQYISANKKESE